MNAFIFTVTAYLCLETSLHIAPEVPQQEWSVVQVHVWDQRSQTIQNIATKNPAQEIRRNVLILGSNSAATPSTYGHFYIQSNQIVLESVMHVWK